MQEAHTKCLVMPQQRRTRAADRTRRIQAERELNAAYISKCAVDEAAVRNKPPPTDLWNVNTHSVICDEPPPF